MERKLTVILSARPNGHSGPMRDGVATFRTLTAYQEAMATLIQHHRGRVRVPDKAGSNFVAEFTSAVDAVQCAVDIQHMLKARNAELPDRRRVEFDIGINRGDTIIDGNRIYGDGVDVAAWLRKKGICISGAVYDQIKNKLALRYEPLGEYSVKNIAELVPVYRVRVGF